MLKKTVITLLGAIVVVVAYWLISPLFVNREVNEELKDIQLVSDVVPPSVKEPTIQTEPVISQIEPEILSVGSFTSLTGHNAEGMAKLIKIDSKYYVRFEDDFKVTNGPDLFVYFGKNGKYDANAQLSALKGNIGGQNYEVPAEINVADYNEVWIWCRAFSVPFGKAILK